jgi:dTDP-4-dehydrorhamnose 3,5-epimerase
MAFTVTETALEGLLILQPDVFGDHRGFFMELFNAAHFAGLGLGNLHFVQDNLSRSVQGTIRGLHFQGAPHAQGKLVSVLEGEVLDVAVDVRVGSPTYDQHVAIRLSAESKTMFYLPPGFAHGFQVLSPSCLFFYKCTDVYHKATEGGLRWNDPALNIAWEPIPAVVSPKDEELPLLADFVSPFTY